MDTLAEIQKLCEQITRDFHPERIILFGSHAYGTPTLDSDVDLLVVMPFEGRHTQQTIKIRSRIDTPLPLTCSSARRSKFQNGWRWAISSCAKLLRWAR